MTLHYQLDLMRDSLPAWLKEANTPGVAVAFLERGSPPRYLCSGVQDLESQRPITPSTVFEAASLGKPLLAYLALLLASEGKLDLDTPMSGILPEPWVPDEERLALITARRVLSHSSGLPNWLNDNEPRKLFFTPGERFGYSGEGFLYLQHVMEKITGLPLEAFTRQRLFEPMRMARTSFVCPEEFAAETAQGHDADGHPLPKWKPWANAGTSLHTTLIDYARFMAQMFSADGPLSPDTLSRMLLPQTPIDEATAWGLGWGLKRISGDLIFWQWGDNGGWKHVAAGSVAQGLGLLALTNGERGSLVWNHLLRHTLDPQGEIFAWLTELK
jgi:CubicO group peptidase (beta-lactamase class C family)